MCFKLKIPQHINKSKFKQWKYEETISPEYWNYRFFHINTEIMAKLLIYVLILTSTLNLTTQLSPYLIVNPKSNVVEEYFSLRFLFFLR